MAEVTETFNKINDYTLRLEQKETEKSGYRVELRTKCSRTFNFLARQVDVVYSAHAYNTYNAEATQPSTQMRVESFDEMPSTLEIKFMHAKLIEMGGKPPALEDILPNEMFKGKQGPRAVPSSGTGG